MRPWKRWADEKGSASLEFITIGLVLLVPLVYLVLAMSAIQSAAMAAEGGARQAARVFVQSTTDSAAERSAIRAVEFALADGGVNADTVAISVTCDPQPTRCLSRRGFVTVTIDVSVPLPLVPPVFADSFPLTVPLHATATQQVSRFWRDR